MRNVGDGEAPTVGGARASCPISSLSATPLRQKHDAKILMRSCAVYVYIKFFFSFLLQLHLFSIYKSLRRAAGKFSLEHPMWRLPAPRYVFQHNHPPSFPQMHPLALSFRFVLLFSPALCYVHEQPTRKCESPSSDLPNSGRAFRSVNLQPLNVKVAWKILFLIETLKTVGVWCLKQTEK